MKEIEIYFSKSGIPCLWESGGGMTRTGYSTLIADKDGKPKKALFINTSGHLACGNHALVPLKLNDYIINHSRKEDASIIYQVVLFDLKNRLAKVKKINSSKYGEWEFPLTKKFVDVVHHAREKASHYHCRKPYFVIYPKEMV